MIPQRNLSLLANRLYKEHGGRRIPEAVLERDYCLAWFLVGLSRCKLRDLLIFKGGTALKRCHFGDYRFSEDLDFTLARRVEFAEIREGLEEVYELVAQASGIRFSFEAEDRQTHVNSYTFYLRYQGPLPTSNTVKVDITVAEILLFPVEQPPVLRTYPEFEDIPEDCPISVYSLNEIATEKVVALQAERATSRATYTISGSSPLTQVSKSVTSSEPLRKKSAFGKEILLASKPASSQKKLA
jgi:uncharacterized protein